MASIAQPTLHETLGYDPTADMKHFLNTVERGYNPFEDLGILRNATSVQIKRAYTGIVKKCHHDRPRAVPWLANELVSAARRASYILVDADLLLWLDIDHKRSLADAVPGELDKRIAFACGPPVPSRSIQPPPTPCHPQHALPTFTDVDFVVLCTVVLVCCLSPGIFIFRRQRPPQQTNLQRGRRPLSVTTSSKRRHNSQPPAKRQKTTSISRPLRSAPARMDSALRKRRTADDEIIAQGEAQQDMAGRSNRMIHLVLMMSYCSLIPLHH